MMARYYAQLQFKVSEGTIERAWMSSPDPNADGTIDWYKSLLGQFVSIAGIHADSMEEAEQQFERLYPVTYREEETRITLKSLAELG